MKTIIEAQARCCKAVVQVLETDHRTAKAIAIATLRRPES